MNKAALCAILLAFCAPSYAVVISGKVVAVADGDTLTIVDSQNKRVIIRLAEIDAPEKRQAWGAKSRRSLSVLCQGKIVAVSIRGRDRYRRALGHVSCGGVMANDRQVETGMAWVYRSKNPKLLAAEAAAKADKRGLWSSPAPVPPWEFRKRK
jgi:endonuclease YncB( thermonuclease family)